MNFIRYNGILLMICSAFFFSANGAIVKYLSPEISFKQAMIFRYAVAVLVTTPFILQQKASFFGNNKPLIWLRCLFGFIASIGQYYVYTELKLGTAISLLYTSPIFVAILSMIVFKERVTSKLMAYILGAFVGCLFIIQPELNVGLLNSGVALISALGAASAYVVVKKLHDSEHFLTIVFNFSFFSLIGSLVIGWNDLVVPNTPQLMLLIGLGVSGAIAQYAMTYAYKYSEASLVSPFSYSAIMFGLIWGFAIWNERPDAVSLFGMLILLVCGIWLSRHSRSRSKT